MTLAKRKHVGVASALTASVAAAALAIGAQSADASTITSRDCGTVGANSSCQTPSASYSGGRCTLFRLANGPGVDHVAILYDVRGEGTAQDVYSPRVSISSSIVGTGQNVSSSGHHYLIYQVTC